MRAPFPAVFARSSGWRERRAEQTRDPKQADAVSIAEYWNRRSRRWILIVLVADTVAHAIADGRGSLQRLAGAPLWVCVGYVRPALTDKFVRSACDRALASTCVRGPADAHMFQTRNASGRQRRGG
jgi:hypothetical protein